MYRIIPNKRILCKGNGLEIHNLVPEILRVENCSPYTKSLINAHEINKTLNSYISQEGNMIETSFKNLQNQNFKLTKTGGALIRVCAFFIRNNTVDGVSAFINNG